MFYADLLPFNFELEFKNKVKQKRIHSNAICVFFKFKCNASGLVCVTNSFTLMQHHFPMPLSLTLQYTHPIGAEMDVHFRRSLFTASSTARVVLGCKCMVKIAHNFESIAASTFLANASKCVRVAYYVNWRFPEHCWKLH